MRKSAFITVLLGVLLAASCSDKEAAPADYLFSRIDSEESGIDFSNTVTEDKEHNIIKYIYFYNGGGVAVGDVNNDDLPDLYFVSNQEANRLYLNRGGLTFEDVTDTAGVSGTASWNTGAIMVDINDDGLLDIYVCAVSGLLDFEGHNELFVNNGDGTFTERSADYGLDFQGYSTQAYFFDYDKDNDLDAYIVNHAIHTVLSFGEADKRYERQPLVGDVLLKNEGGTFADASEEAGIYGGVNGYGLSATVADFNNDGWEDIYVCNDFHEDDYYYLNNQDGTFREDHESAFSIMSRFSMGSDAADLNGDGYLDLITLDMLPKGERILKETEGDDAMFNMQERLRALGYKDQYSRNMLHLNQSGEYFQEVALINGMADTDWSWGPLIADYDNDGYPDVFIANGILRRPNGMDFTKYVSSAFKNRSQEEGMDWLYQSITEMPGGTVPNEIFRGGPQGFSPKTGIWMEKEPQISNGAVYSDLDRDGDLDLVVNNFNRPAVVYRNDGDGVGSYVSLDFEYRKGNRHGLGTRVDVYSGERRHSMQLMASRGFVSSVESRLHLGMGKDSIIDSIRVCWPDNRVQTFTGIASNTHHTFSYEASKTRVREQEEGRPNGTFRPTELVAFEHEEDGYNDFFTDKLIPYRISTLGPAVAVGDVDGNGYEDLFLGNASGAKASFYWNTGTTLVKADLPEIDKDSLYEDNAAELFDADGDGDLDLYVGSGIHSARNKRYEDDRLYLFEDGTFTRSANHIPLNLLLTTTVSAGDYDGDGDQDLFVGNLADPDNYGLNVESRLLLNNGSGVFTFDANFELKSKVNASAWEDINEDGEIDLLLATEWDTPRVYLNQQGKLVPANLPDNMNGLWLSIAAWDADGDGDRDIILGNWGENNKYSYYSDGPLRMYHSDFDLNGKWETVLAYNRGGTYYPINSRTELGSQMPVLLKRFPDYTSFAGQDIERVMTDGSLGLAAMYEVEQFSTGYLRNNRGKFEEFVRLPDDFQLAPVTSFYPLDTGLIVAGNSQRVNTYHGAYRSLKGLVLQEKEASFPLDDLGVDPIHDQVRRIIRLKLSDRSVLIVVTNNGPVKAYERLAK